MNPAERACDRCAHDRAWLIRPVRERSRLMVVEIVPVDLLADTPEKQLGWYEALVCAKCGHAILWARDYQGQRSQAEQAGCLDCESRSAWLIAEAPDADQYASGPMRVQLAPYKLKPSMLLSRGGWRAGFAVSVCAGCGRASWRCRPDQKFEEDVGRGETSPRACVRCAGPQLLVSLRDQEFQDSHERAVQRQRTLIFERSRGHFVVDVCLACQTVEWYGDDLDELTEDAKGGVSLIQRGVASSDGGPYR